MIPDFTVVVALDRGHLEQFYTVWPTWVAYRPEIMQRRLVLIVDLADHERDDALRRWVEGLQFVLQVHPQVEFFEWDWRPDLPQRERMLTGLVRAGDFVQTPYYLKLDVDAIATKPGPWIMPEWFAESPALIASPWSYSRPGSVIETLDRWGDGIPDLCSKPPLGFRPVAGSEIVKHPRIISWCCFVNTEFSRWASSLAPERLPVPSQDTYLFYCAARAGKKVVTVKMKSYGWDHCLRTSTLRRISREVLKSHEQRAT